MGKLPACAEDLPRHKPAQSLLDIHYNARLEGRNYTPPGKLPYALVVSVRAKGIADLYDQVVRKYATQLEPLRPVVEIPVRT